LKQWVELLESFVVVALVLAGLGGITYRMFRAGGWIDTSLEQVWDLELRHVFIALVVIVLGVVVFRLLHGDRALHSKTSIVPTAILYALMATGAYFIGHYAITGVI